MLFALLFNGSDELIAAAPAVFQYSVGDNYWREFYSGDVNIDADCQTAYAETDDDQLIDKLNSLEHDDQHLAECRSRIDELTVTQAKVKVQSSKTTRAA